MAAHGVRGFQILIAQLFPGPEVFIISHVAETPMKTTSIPMFGATLAMAMLIIPSAQAGPKHRNPADIRIDGKGSAMREEALLDKRDTHGQLGLWDKDKRPKEVQIYHALTFKRIRSLLANGKLTEEQGTTFKTLHEEITADLTSKRSDGLTEEERSSVRGSLDQLNDAINAVIGKAEEGNARTPLLNQKQHAMEERIQFGERSGRLSKGEAASMRRKLERIQEMEERLKKNELTTREREKLHEEMNQTLLELNRELR